MQNHKKGAGKTSRRGFLGQALTATGAAIAAPSLLEQANAAKATAQSSGDETSVSLNVNGKLQTLSIEPRVTLLDALRDRLGLVGSKKGCDRGQCGACTVLIDGERVYSCLTLAIMQEGKEIVKPNIKFQILFTVTLLPLALPTDRSKALIRVQQRKHQVSSLFLPIKMRIR